MHALIFDLDGTLTHTFYSEDNSYLQAVKQVLPIDENLAYWNECPHLSDSGVLHYFFQKYKKRLPHAEEIEKVKQLFLSRLEEKHTLHPQFFSALAGVHTMLHELQKKQKVFTGIATGSWKHIADFKMQKAELHTFNIPITGSDLHAEKENQIRAMLHHLQQINGVNHFESTTYFGDSIKDLEAAQALNMHFIGVDQRKKGMFKNCAVPVLDDFSDLNSLFSLLPPSLQHDI